MPKLSKEPSILKLDSSQRRQLHKTELTISPFVYMFEIDDTMKCLFHSLSMQKKYLTTEAYLQILTDLSSDNITDEVRELIEMKFFVPQDFDQQKEFDSLADRVLRKKPSPYLSYVLVTDYCNFRCGYCFIENALSGSSKVMSKELADKVIKALVNAAKDVKEYRVTFYGGEPLSNSEIVFYIIENLKRQSEKFQFSIITNGSLVTEEIARKLKQNKVNVGLSLDGWANIDQNRIFTDGKGTFYPTLKALAVLKEEGVNLGVSCTITKQNYEHAEELVEFFHRLGIKNIGFNLLTRLGKNRSEYEVPEAKQLAQSLFKAYLKAKKLHMFEDRISQRRANYFFRQVIHTYDCPAFGQQIFFSPDGTVGPCQAFYPSGKYQIPIKENLEAQNEPVFHEWFKLATLRDRECMNCSAVGICGGACAYDIYSKTGKIGIKDEYFCTFQKEILKLLISYNFILNREMTKNRSLKGKRK